MNNGARYGVPVSGRVAYVLARLYNDTEARLDKAGFRGGSPRAEALREEVLTAVELLRERGDAWHAAQRGDSHVEPAFTPAFTESPASASPRPSSAMNEALTQTEAAEILGLTAQRVGQLRSEGRLSGRQDERGRWLYDGDEVREYRDQRVEVAK